jgi:hypothetical protein
MWFGRVVGFEKASIDVVPVWASVNGVSIVGLKLGRLAPAVKRYWG